MNTYLDKTRNEKASIGRNALNGMRDVARQSVLSWHPEPEHE